MRQGDDAENCCFSATIYLAINSKADSYRVYISAPAQSNSLQRKAVVFTTEDLEILKA